MYRLEFLKDRPSINKRIYKVNLKVFSQVKKLGKEMQVQASLDVKLSK